MLLLDIRVLPNSHGGLIYLKENLKNPLALTLPILNVRYSYTPIIFAFSYMKLINILENYFFWKNNTPKTKDDKLIYFPNRLNNFKDFKILEKNLYMNKTLSNYSFCNKIKGNNDYENKINYNEFLLKNELKTPFDYLEDTVFIAYTQNT